MLYHFQRSRRQTAKNAAISMLVLLFQYGFLRYLAVDNSQYDELLEVTLYGLIVVELALTAWVLWLLANPAQFEIRVSEQEFSINHPTFSRWSFSVNPKDIARIDQIMTGVDFRQEARLVVLHNGQTFEICRNYRYSIKDLYAALQQANPAIVLPANPYLFKVKT